MTDDDEMWVPPGVRMGPDRIKAEPARWLGVVILVVLGTAVCCAGLCLGVLGTFAVR
jgi:hypothetical protein